MRVDVPTLRCDRCGNTTQDIEFMASFQKVGHYHMTGKDEWDLCPGCWIEFRVFMRVSGDE